MPRKTNEQKYAEIQEHQRLEELRRESEYFQRLMDVLDQAGKFGISTIVKDRAFTLESKVLSEHFQLPLEYTKKSWSDLDILEWDLTVHKNKLIEEERRARVRQTALSKLTAEERELLGV